MAGTCRNVHCVAYALPRVREAGSDDYQDAHRKLYAGTNGSCLHDYGDELRDPIDQRHSQRERLAADGADGYFDLGDRLDMHAAGRALLTQHLARCRRELPGDHTHGECGQQRPGFSYEHSYCVRWRRNKYRK